jgi:phospholipid transport system substrate-binding protein
MKHFLHTALVFFALASLAFAASDPVALLKKNDADLQKVLAKKSHSDADIERIKKLSNGLFDFGKMAEKALPKKVWEGLDSASKAEFTYEFKRMIENASVDKFRRANMNASDSTVYDPAKYRKDSTEVWVTVHAWDKGKEMVMVYKMDLEGNDWRVWDLVVDDLSTTRNYRDQFETILETKPFPELVNTIKKKADEYGAKK